MTTNTDALKGFGIRADLNLVLLDAITQQMIANVKEKGVCIKGEAANFSNSQQKGGISPILVVDRGGTGKTSHINSMFDAFKNFVDGSVYQRSMSEIGAKKTIAGMETTKSIDDINSKIAEYNKLVDSVGGINAEQSVKDDIHKYIFGDQIKNNSKAMFFDEEALGSNLPKLVKEVATGKIEHVTSVASRNFSSDVSKNIYIFASNGLQIPKSVSIAEKNTAFDRCLFLGQKSIRFTKLGQEVVVNRNSFYKEDDKQSMYKNILIGCLQRVKDLLDNPKVDYIDLTPTQEEMNYINQRWDDIEKFNLAGLQVGRAKNKFIGLVKRMDLLLGMNTDLFEFIVDIASSMLFPTTQDIFCSNNVIEEEIYKMIVENYRQGKYMTTYSLVKDHIEKSGKTFDSEKETLKALKNLVNNSSVLFYNNLILSKRI